MFDTAFMYIFSVGMAAAFNPCGAAMFPAYVGYQLGTLDPKHAPVESAVRGILMGLATTAGFIVVFGVAGIALAAGARVLRDLLPFIGLGIGIVIAGAGLFLLVSRRHIGITTASRVNLGQGRGLQNVFLFGIAYALASLSCALPLFLVAIGISIGQDTNAGYVPTVLIRTITYGFGMGTVIIIGTFCVIFFKNAAYRSMRAVFPYMESFGKLAMVIAGGYLIFYWTMGDGSTIFHERVESMF